MALFLFIFVCSGSFAAILEVSSPKDKAITQLPRVPINCTASDIKGLNINGTGVDLEKGKKLEAVAILKAGKNVIAITATPVTGEKIARKIRVLRIITFDDIETLYEGKQHWAKPQILLLSTLGIIEGYPDNTFQPDRPISRGELATWIARSRNIKVFAPKEDIFYDVPKEHWRAPYIKAIVDSGIMKGTSKDKFGINEPVSRSEAVGIFMRAYNISKQPVTKKSPFSDVTSGAEDAEGIISVFNSGLVVGVMQQNRVFEPERPMKRAEVVLVISRLKSMKVLRTQLYDFGIGYTSARYCRIGTKPVIRKAGAYPSRLMADGKTPIKLAADIFDAQGSSDISQVWVDLTSIRGPNNAKFNIMQDGTYELSFIMSTEVEGGEKGVTIGALDKSGLKSYGVVKFTVTKEKQ